MTPDLIIFLIMAVIAVISAVGMLVSRNAVYSTLFLVLNVVIVAVLYLLLNAAFIAMVQVTVYAGAIMVLFLFVVMLLGAERLSGEARIRWQRPAAVLLGLALVAETAFALFLARGGGAAPVPSVAADFGSPAAVGGLLFRDYLIPIEVASVVLLVAMVGAIVLSRDERKKGQ